MDKYSLAPCISERSRGLRQREIMGFSNGYLEKGEGRPAGAAYSRGGKGRVGWALTGAVNVGNRRVHRWAMAPMWTEHSAAKVGSQSTDFGSGSIGEWTSASQGLVIRPFPCGFSNLPGCSWDPSHALRCHHLVAYFYTLNGSWCHFVFLSLQLWPAEPTSAPNSGSRCC